MLSESPPSYYDQNIYESLMFCKHCQKHVSYIYQEKYPMKAHLLSMLCCCFCCCFVPYYITKKDHIYSCNRCGKILISIKI